MKGLEEMMSAIGKLMGGQDPGKEGESGPANEEALLAKLMNDIGMQVPKEE